MKVLIVHVPYEHRGGEEVHVDALALGYQKIGVTPLLFPTDRNPPTALLGKSIDSLKQSDDSPEIAAFWNDQKPVYIHLHNAFPTLGPRFFRWAIRHRVPIAMTVHNHRFFCTNGLALRDKRICKDCFSSKVAWRSMIYNCNGDLKKTIYHSLALTQMRTQDLHARAITRFVAPSPYLQGELVRVGMPREKVLHILNPVVWTEAEMACDAGAGNAGAEKYGAIYAGRLSQEKGIQELLVTVGLMPEVKFVIAGDGPERPAVEAAAAKLANLDFVGPVTHERVLELIDDSRVAVLPSICNETLSTFALESFFQGKRCVIPALDSTSWLASGDFPGHLAKPGNPYSLAKAIGIALSSPRISLEQKLALRSKLSFERFCSDLKGLVQEMAVVR
ncbi:MAG: glycosyltransferase family 4 protein [Deltaproteobacteria bacterium]|nr:glycosyltransferase family 4 protein [Deltaproteobacteria bacterium]